MCTVSVIPLANGFRLACNRDESRLRAIALPPAIVHHEGVRAVMPRDPDAGGTWIAVTEARLAFTILNLNSEGESPSASGDRSRGEIIPRLILCRTADEVPELLKSMTVSTFRPFRLVVADRDTVLELRSDSAPVRHRLSAPLMFTSSGLGDHLVEAPRRALFQQVMRKDGDPVANQDRFHMHRWRSHPHLSVLMERADARTVSRTVVEVHDGGEIRMDYWAIGEGAVTAAPTYCLGS